MPGFVYILCTITSLASSLLLFRAMGRNASRLLFWSALCFLGMAINNLMLYVDLMVGPSMDLSLMEDGVSVVSSLLLAYGLIWDAT
jgi:hypothetical protein